LGDGHGGVLGFSPNYLLRMCLSVGCSFWAVGFSPRLKCFIIQMFVLFLRYTELFKVVL